MPAFMQKQIPQINETARKYIIAVFIEQAGLARVAA